MVTFEEIKQLACAFQPLYTLYITYLSIYHCFHSRTTMCACAVPLGSGRWSVRQSTGKREVEVRWSDRNTGYRHVVRPLFVRSICIYLYTGRIWIDRHICTGSMIQWSSPFHSWWWWWSPQPSSSGGMGGRRMIGSSITTTVAVVVVLSSSMIVAVAVVVVGNSRIHRCCCCNTLSWWRPLLETQQHGGTGTAAAAMTMTMTMMLLRYVWDGNPWPGDIRHVMAECDAIEHALDQCATTVTRLEECEVESEEESECERPAPQQPPPGVSSSSTTTSSTTTTNTTETTTVLNFLYE